MKSETLVTEVPIHPDILADILASDAETIIGRWRGFTIIGRVVDGFNIAIHYKGRLSKVDVEGLLVVRRGRGYVSYIFTGDESKLIIDMRIRRGRFNTILFIEAVYEGRGERAAKKMLREITREISRYVLEKISEAREELAAPRPIQPSAPGAGAGKPSIPREALEEKTVPIEEATRPLGGGEAPGVPSREVAEEAARRIEEAVVEKGEEAAEKAAGAVAGKPAPGGEAVGAAAPRGPEGAARVEREIKALPIDYNRMPDRSLYLADPVRLANILLRSRLLYRGEEEPPLSLRRILGYLAGRRDVAAYNAVYVSIKTPMGEGRVLVEDDKITGAYALIGAEERLGVDALRAILSFNEKAEVKIWGVSAELS